MIFKRNEGFRFVFGEPLEANYVILLDGKPISIEQPRVACDIIDISPRGMKMVTETDFTQYSGHAVQLEIYFMLDKMQIKAIGDIVWSKQLGQKTQYGITFPSQSNLDDIIISELKARRKREVAEGKVKKI